MSKRNLTRTMAVLLAAGLLYGCSQVNPTPGDGDRAGRLLERTLSAVEKERPAYRSRTELVVAGIPVPGPKVQTVKGADGAQSLEWDPYESLRFLREAGKTVKLEEDPDLPNGRMLQIDIDSSVWTERVRKEWHSRIDLMQTEGQTMIRNQTAKVSGGQAEQLGRELTDSLEKARSRLERMVATLKAGGTYRIRLAPDSASPQELVIENRLQYDTDGTTREETVRTTYDFRRNSSP